MHHAPSSPEPEAPHEVPCGRCRVLTAVAFLVDVSDRVPIGDVRWCESCDAELDRERYSAAEAAAARAYEDWREGERRRGGPRDFDLWRENARHACSCRASCPVHSRNEVDW